MTRLTIATETPEKFTDIDVEGMANYFGAPIHLVVDLEGTVFPWSYNPRKSRLSQDFIDVVDDARHENTIAGIHSITNRAGVGVAGGLAITSTFLEQINKIHPACITLGEFPLSRSERKPKGVLGARLVARIYAEFFSTPEDRQNTRQKPLVIALVGDKFSDILEADKLMRILGNNVVGFMIKRYGETDHPMDRLFGKRDKATRIRDELRASAKNVFVKK